ncbi:carbamoyltransferase C-terminal domain-containing protein [Streptomyces fructofermentans]|uniref:carbamoyltransferase C-terminal domain-containing protein n=1 Tax=Streptomyces fructofermentans TaxID=152141 RepID=UPI0037A9D6D3
MTIRYNNFGDPHVSFAPSRPEAVAFVIPYYDDGLEWRWHSLRLTLASLERQTDPLWCAYLVDDAAPAAGTAESLADLVSSLSGCVRVPRAPRNAGAGQARNLGIEAAHRDGHALLTYLDADDLAHSGRVAAARALFEADPQLDFAYNDVEFIDEHGASGDAEHLLPGLRMLDEQQRLPKLRGRERWVWQAVERDNIAIPSAMNLRTVLALRVPFADVPFCEDVATLFRYLGSGAKIDHSAGVPTRYRVPREGGSSSRNQSGGVDAFDAQMTLTGSPHIEWSVYGGLDFVRDEAPDPARWSRRALDQDALAAALSAGRVAAWVQGRWEIGPRALGNRSLLADAHSAASKDRLNEIKQREDYRPIAPCARVDTGSGTFGECDDFVRTERHRRTVAHPSFTEILPGPRSLVRRHLMAFTAFSREIWREIWPNNPQERLNRDLPPHQSWSASSPTAPP